MFFRQSSKVVGTTLRSFWKNQKENPPNELIKYAKDPKLFAEYAKKYEESQTEEQKQYKKMQQGFKNVAISKKNMAIDMRPGVVARTMTYELIFLCFGISMVIGFPLYFYKLKPMQEEIKQRYNENLARVQEEDQQKLTSAQRSYSLQNYKQDVTMSTQMKSSRFSEQEMQEQIKKTEQEYEKEVLRQKRLERRKARLQRKKQQQSESDS